MKKFIYFAIGIAAMLMASSCEKDVFNSTSGEGGFSLALSINNNETLTSRAATTNNDNIIANANVKIYKPNFDGLIRQYTYSQMDEVIYLPTGNGYRVDVVAGEAAKTDPDKANFESKSYNGSADFNIVANQITENVKVVAKISNAITNVSFDETIGQNFNDYKLTFALADLTKADAPVAAEDKLEYSASQTGEGYFIVDDPVLETKLFWVFEGTKKDNTPFTAKGEIAATDATGNSLVGTRHTMNFKYIVKDGTLTFTLVVDSNTTTQQDNIVWTPTSTGLSTIKTKDIWATFVNINADVDTKEYDGDVYIQYRKKSDADWVNPDDASATKIKATGDDEGVFSAVITGLDSATDYQCRLVVYKNVTTEGVTTQEFVDVNSVKEFTTAKAQQVPNASFEDTSLDSSGKYYSFYNPASTILENQTKWWDSGNMAASTVISNPNEALTRYDVGYDGTGKSALLHTQTPAADIIAAGNIYSGFMHSYDFDLLNFKASGIVCFGQKFEGRPTKIKMWVKYNGAGNGKSPTTKLINGTDEGQIKIALGHWDKGTYGKNGKGTVVGTENSPVTVDTSNSKTFIDYVDDAKKGGKTIAYGDAIFKADGTTYINDPDFQTAETYKCNDWKQIEIPIVYYNTAQPVTHIIISGAASRFGDYFEGYNGSKLWIDNIELIYDDDLNVYKE